MTGKPRQIKDDPGVAEVRRWRAKLWKEGGGTLHGFIELIRASQAASEAAGKVVIRKKKSVSPKSKKGRSAA